LNAVPKADARVPSQPHESRVKKRADREVRRRKEEV
jgi:hypothetical protein